MRFVKESVIAASAETVFSFHERPDAFRLLLPPWQQAEIIQPPTSLAVGTRVIVRVKVGPIWQTIEAKHVAYAPGRMFEDDMIRGPFRSWRHTHEVVPQGDASSILRDDVQYELPLAPVSELLGAWWVRRTLTRMFDYRHQVTRAACEIHS